VKKVYNAEPLGYSKTAVDKWNQLGFNYIGGSWAEVEDNSQFEDVEVLIVRLAKRVDNSILKRFPNLEYLVSATTGHDHIDIDALKNRSVKLISLRGHDEFLRTIPSTAEHTWALLMALIRNIPGANNDVLKGNWNRDNFRGYQLKDKVLGIIGYGRTGQKVAHYADAFGMEVVFFDPYVNSTKSNHIKVERLEYLLVKSDVISLHVHLTPDTENLLNETNLSFIQKGAFLINTSRGKVLDEAAVCKSLSSGNIAGIAVDVLTTELTDIQKSELWLMQQRGENIIITPHIGGATWDAMHACEDYVTGLVKSEIRN
jgi:D-3-phosphoglycerate dehydrogenase